MPRRESKGTSAETSRVTMCGACTWLRRSARELWHLAAERHICRVLGPYDVGEESEGQRESSTDVAK